LTYTAAGDVEAGFEWEHYDISTLRLVLLLITVALAEIVLGFRGVIVNAGALTTASSTVTGYSGIGRGAITTVLAVR
jgi:hypothetical protein